MIVTKTYENLTELPDTSASLRFVTESFETGYTDSDVITLPKGSLLVRYIRSDTRFEWAVYTPRGISGGFHMPVFPVYLCTSDFIKHTIGVVPGGK